MVRNYPTMSGGHRYCGSGDMVFVVIEGQDFSCPCLDPPLLLISKAHACHANTHEISGSRHSNLPVYPRKDFQTCMSTRVNDKTYLKSFCQSVLKQR